MRMEVYGDSPLLPPVLLLLKCKTLCSILQLQVSSHLFTFLSPCLLCAQACKETGSDGGGSSGDCIFAHLMQELAFTRKAK